jgi:hypothetical protein
LRLSTSYQNPEEVTVAVPLFDRTTVTVAVPPPGRVELVADIVQEVLSVQLPQK